jgi:protein PhnA
VEGCPEPDPDPDWAILACEGCRDAMRPKARLDADALRFLETAIWSDVVPAQVAAVRLTRRVAEAGGSWAREALEGLYLDPDVEERL